jgi:putative FmdB family regulatory protein
MPTYRYRCAKCGDELEVWQSFSDKPLARHNGGCGGKLAKVMSPAGIVLKGSGFYKTDNRRSGGSSSESKGDKSEKKGTDSKSGDSGSASSSKSKSSDSSSSGSSSSGSGKTTSAASTSS